MIVKEEPVSVLRKMPRSPHVLLVADLTDTTIVAPRGATPEIPFPVSSEAVNCVQFVPPFVVRSITPIGPLSPKLLTFEVPATSVLFVASVGSSFIAPMESELAASVCGGHVGLALVAFVVVQMPPLTEPAHTMSAFVGCATSALIAPTTGAFVIPSTWPFCIGAAPWATHVPPTAGRL